MGKLFEFRCASCGYRREVSGGTDVGMTSATATVVCANCSELYDVAVSDKPWEAGRSQPVKTIPCPDCKSFSLKRWRHPGPCPKCQSKLDRSGPTVYWD
jgi:uncharacterized paraquat-inducible protein A